MLVAATVGLAAAGCTDDRRAEEPTPSSSTVAPSMTFEEAYRKLPMNGTKALPITWDLSALPDTDEVLAARRSLAFIYWERQATDWTEVIPIGRFVYTEAFYEEFLAPFARSSAVQDPLIGPIWVKVMGVERTGPNRATVTFCTDHGYWRHAEEKHFKVRQDRANLESYVMENVESGDGERHWLADHLIDNDGDRQAKYGAECTKWARHQA
ncbi:hypothetical protein GCM10010168_83820 [Actinoplanes ianthinogenes]|uniref:Lipoprotein n=2 Tax=Actinoplanes ianthinogenes TaxID=122358 RepID=A0ABM7M0D6_9ACTN|nr:hypothetical protein Aiant_57010 [Actinoplanes ianthinogenes]GGR52265.1 hypothetical protein GCM10010168_83820 [Actinoplanes ianthinogenes]